MHVYHERKTLLEALQLLLNELEASKEIQLSHILNYLPKKGYTALLILFSLPFCLPIQIPGFSTPFGLLLALLGFRMAFFKTPWWPAWLLKKKFASAHVKALVLKVMRVVEVLQKLLRPRLLFLTRNPLLNRLHGLLILIMALLLSLPLPIPMTNLLAAFPIFFMGLGLLEDDGVAILLSYVGALICLAAFAGLFFFGMDLTRFLLAFFN